MRLSTLAVEKIKTKFLLILLFFGSAIVVFPRVDLSDPCSFFSTSKGNMCGCPCMWDFLCHHLFFKNCPVLLVMLPALHSPRCLEIELMAWFSHLLFLNFFLPLKGTGYHISKCSFENNLPTEALLFKEMFL